MLGASFQLGLGQVLGVVGANGSGKTTLLRIVAGELAHDIGDVTLGDAVPGQRTYVGQIAYVPQRPDAWAGSMEQYLQWIAALGGVRSRDANRAALDDTLAWLDLTTRKSSRCGELSEGLRMRVAIAAAVLTRPRLLILDEPLAPLDPLSQLSLLGRIRRWTRDWRGLMTILSSQHVPEVELVADRTLYLQDGKVDATEPVRASDVVYEITPHDDHEGFRALERVLKALCEQGVVTGVVRCEQYAMIASLADPLPLHVFAHRISAARPRMVRDVSSSARRKLLGGKQVR